jgi:hypothetical protein
VGYWEKRLEGFIRRRGEMMEFEREFAEILEKREIGKEKRGRLVTKANIVVDVLQNVLKEQSVEALLFGPMRKSNRLKGVVR